MPYILSGSQIRAPHKLSESNNTMVAQNRTLDGQINRDYFGANKRVWVLEYNNVLPSEYNTIKTIHTAYMTTNTPVSWEITEANYSVSPTTVHVNLEEREFKVRGNDYISDFTLTLTEM